MNAVADTARAGQRAFLGLLTRPLVTPASDPDLHRELARNGKSVSDAARRLGYRLTTVGRAIRLVRVPVAGTVTTPPPPLDMPTRRVLALACVLAAVCEDTSGGATLSRLSGLVQQLTVGATATVTEYDQSQQAHRRQLLRAVRVLEHWGVLRRRTDDERLLEDWADAGNGIGAGYEIDRDALLLITSPDVLALALDRGHIDEEQSATRSLRALRSLVETPAVLYSEMDPLDASTLRDTRGLRANDAAAITGGHVEARAEGLVLIVTDDPPSPVTMDWPRASASSWVALLMADLAGRAGLRQPDGTVTLTDEQVGDVVTDLCEWRGEYMTKGMREDRSTVRPVAEQQLTHLGLLRINADRGWVLSPAAGRYRDPDIVLPDRGGTPNLAALSLIDTTPDTEEVS